MSRGLIDDSCPAYLALIPAPDALCMDITTRSADPVGRLDLVGVIRCLVFLQGALLVASVVEATVFLSFVGPSGAGAGLLTALAAALTLLAAAGIARRSRRARRWTFVAEVGVLLLAAVDVALAAILGGQMPATSLVMRVVIPVVVIVLLRRAEVRVAFGVRSAGGAA